MEDETGLELSLSLSYGGSSCKFKVKDAPSDTKGDEGSASRLMGSSVTDSDDSLQNLYKSGLENQEPKGKQKNNFIVQPQENFFTDLAKCSVPINDCSNDARNNLSQFIMHQELLISSNRPIETEEDKSGSNKRKLPFEEINFQNKHAKLIDYVDKHGAKNSGAPLLRNSHVSNATEDGSLGENEDVAESEEEGSQSWLVSQREENAKCSDALKINSKSILSESNAIGSQSLREPCLSGKESNPEYGKPTFGIPLSLQPLQVMNNPYPVHDTVPSTSSRLDAASFPSCVMQLMPIANGERPANLTENTNSLQFAFGYPSVKLPTLETGSSWAFNSQPLQISSFTSRERSTCLQSQEHFENGVKTSQGAAPHKTSAAFPYDGKSSDLVIGESMKKPGFRGEEPPAATIRPGIAPNLRFGGCGSYPDLPWVSTTGQGQNGNTISGVTYKYNQNQIKIVCACHGTHMSPEEFVQHANADVPNSENNPNLASFPISNTTNSAQN